MRLFLALSLLTTGLSAQAGEIYCNAQGRECSDRPTASANIPRGTGVPAAATRAKVPAGATSSAQSQGNGASDPNAAPDTGAKADPVAEQQRQNAKLAAASKALQKDLNDKRSEQCKKAQDYYKQSLEAAAIFRTDKDGKKQYLTEAEANQTRLNARLEIERTCGKSGS